MSMCSNMLHRDLDLVGGTLMSLTTALRTGPNANNGGHELGHNLHSQARLQWMNSIGSDGRQRFFALSQLARLQRHKVPEHLPACSEGLACTKAQTGTPYAIRCVFRGSLAAAGPQDAPRLAVERATQAQSTRPVSLPLCGPSLLFVWHALI